MNRYLVSIEYNSEIFDQMCEALEARIPGIIRGSRLTDVDSSVCQHYDLDGKDILVLNSAYMDDVSVTSEADLSPYLEQANETN